MSKDKSRAQIIWVVVTVFLELGRFKIRWRRMDLQRIVTGVVLLPGQVDPWLLVRRVVEPPGYHRSYNVTT